MQPKPSFALLLIPLLLSNLLSPPAEAQTAATIQLVVVAGEGAINNVKERNTHDVIVEVQQNEVTSPADVQKRVEAARKQDRKFVLMLIQGQDGTRYVPVQLASPKGKG